MTTSQDIFEQIREQNEKNIHELENFNAKETIPKKVQEVMISSKRIIVISKEGAKDFHAKVKDRIKETGYGLFEYVELIKFFEKIKDIISGNSQSKNPEEKEGDKEFKDMIRTEIIKYGKLYTTARGVKFELAETGTKYDYSKCNDSILESMIEDSILLAEKIKERQEFLKKAPAAGIEIHVGDGDLVTMYPPSKSSTSSYKTTLPK